jgi:uncharacterized protein YjbI with pentapeptide repeats
MDPEGEGVEAPHGRSKRRGDRVKSATSQSGTRSKESGWHRVIARLRDDRKAAGADLRFLHFSSWDLSGVDFRNANLEGANLSQANLSHADLRGANLRSAKLLGARLCGAALEGATLSGALVQGADFSAALGLTAAQKAELPRQGAKI